MLTPIPRQLTLAPLIDDARLHGDAEQPARIVEVSTSPFHFMLLTADGQAISVGRICPAPVRTQVEPPFFPSVLTSLLCSRSRRTLFPNNASGSFPSECTREPSALAPRTPSSFSE